MERIFLFPFYSLFEHCSNEGKYFALVLTEIVFSNLPCIIASSRSSYQRSSVEKAILIHFTNFTGKHLCWSLFLIKFTKAFWRISANDNIKISIDQLSSQKSVLYKNLQIMLIRHSKKKCSTSLNLFKRGTTRFHSQIHKH